MVLRPERRGLGDLALLARRRVLALGQAVDLVVEEQDLQRHVAAQRVDQVVAADRERVAVAAHHPHRQVRPRGGHARGQRRRAPVDAVHPVGVHVVDEPPRAADAGDEHDLLGRDAQLRHEATGPRRGSRSRRSPGTSASPGRRRSRPCSAAARRGRARDPAAVAAVVSVRPLAHAEPLLDLLHHVAREDRQAVDLRVALARRPGTPPAAASTAGPCSSPGTSTRS